MADWRRLAAIVVWSPKRSVLPESPVPPFAIRTTELGLPARAVYKVGTTAREELAWGWADLAMVQTEQQEQRPRRVPRLLSSDLVVAW